MVFTRLRYIEDDENEVLWVRLRPQKLPRKYPSIIIACIYHPPKADNGSMREYMITNLDSILRCYPECGIILTGDFNQLRDSFLLVHYGYVQLVNMATRNGAILDKIWSNMSPVYAHPAVLSEVGSSDHRMVLHVPSSYPTFRNYDRTNRHVFSTEDGYKAQFRQTMGYRSLSTSDQTKATRTNVG